MGLSVQEQIPGTKLSLSLAFSLSPQLLVGIPIVFQAPHCQALSSVSMFVEYSYYHKYPTNSDVKEGGFYVRTQIRIQLVEEFVRDKHYPRNKGVPPMKICHDLDVSCVKHE